MRGPRLGHWGRKQKEIEMNSNKPDTSNFGNSTYNKHDDHKGHAPRRARGKTRLTKEEMLEQMKKNAAEKAGKA